MYFRRKVQKGTGTGTKIGFPTLNFNVGNFGEYYGEGVYSSEAKIGNIVHKGALFYGHRMSSQTKALEVYVVGLNKMIYGRFVTFRVLKKLRKPKTFKSLEELKKQIQKDLVQV